MHDKKILLVIADQALGSQLSERFSLAGYEIYTAPNIAVAGEALSKMHPDIVMIDIDINGVDGFVFLEAIRSDPNSEIAKIPVIIASKNGDLVEIGRALKFGISDYFVKSTLNLDGVLEKVQKIFRKYSGDQTEESFGNTLSSPLHEITVAVPMTVPSSLPKLLMIEDDKFLRDLAVQKLSQEDLQVFAAVDGEQGIAMAEKEIPDVMLLDILLPGIDGFEVLRRVRTNATLAKTRVAMLSNFGQREDIEKALKGGAEQFLIKANYTLDEIVDEVKKMIARPRV